MGKYKYYAVVFFWIWLVMAVISEIGMLIEKIMKRKDKKTESDDE